MTINPLYQGMPKLVWESIGLLNGYDNLTTKEVFEKNRAFYYAGQKNGWISDFCIEKVRFYKMPEEQWIAFFCENYLNLSREEFKKKANALFFHRGHQLSLINKIYPKEKESIANMSYNEILDLCKSKRYDQLSRRQLYEKEPYIYNTLIERKIIQDLIPKRKTAQKSSIYSGKSKKELFEIGRKKGYDLIIRENLKKTDSEFNNALGNWFSEFTRNGRKQHGFYKNMTDEEMLKYFKDKYYFPGITKRQLCSANGSLYSYLYQRKIMSLAISGDARKKN